MLVCAATNLRPAVRNGGSPAVPRANFSASCSVSIPAQDEKMDAWLSQFDGVPFPLLAHDVSADLVLGKSHPVDDPRMTYLSLPHRSLRARVRGAKQDYSNNCPLHHQHSEVLAEWLHPQSVNESTPGFPRVWTATEVCFNY